MIHAPFWVRDMDGLVVCAMAGARRGRGFDSRFVCPSRGPLVRSPPPPPSASRSTIGTAGGSVACPVLIVFCPATRYVYFWIIGYEHMETAKSKAPTTTHLQQRAPPPVPLAPPEPHLLLIFLLSEESNLHLQGSGRLHCRCGTWPKRPHYAPLLLGMLCLNRWYAPEAGPAAPSQPHYHHSLCSQVNENEPYTHTHTTDPLSKSAVGRHDRLADREPAYCKPVQPPVDLNPQYGNMQARGFGRQNTARKRVTRQTSVQPVHTLKCSWNHRINGTAEHCCICIPGRACVERFVDLLAATLHLPCYLSGSCEYFGQAGLQSRAAKFCAYCRQ